MKARALVLYGVQDESDEPLETTRILSDVEFALIDVSEHTRTFQIGQEVFRSFPSNLHKNFKLIHLKGFEPLAISLEGCCSIQLS